MNRRGLICVVFACVLAKASDPPTPPELANESNPQKRAEKAVDLADQAFDSAADHYNKGEVHKGDADLDAMMNDLRICIAALEQAHKGSQWKKAELRVAHLQRRLKDLLENIGIEQRGWAEYTDRKLDEIHDKMLEGVMRK